MLRSAAAVAAAILSVASLTPSVIAANLGEWTVIGNAEVTCIHTILLPQNKILCIERPHEFPYSQNNLTNGRTINEIEISTDDGVVTSHSYVVAPDVYENAFCGHHAQMANGSILVVGGDQRELYQASNGSIEIYDTTTNPDVDGTIFLSDGAQGRRIFNPCLEDDDSCEHGTWVQLPNMTTERWYPTLVTLADGTFLIASGSKHNLDLGNYEGNDNPTYEYWPEREGEWPKDLDILSWAFPFSLYPQAYVLPDSRVFLMVSNRTTIIDPNTDTDTSTESLDGSYRDLEAANHAPWLYPFMPASCVMPMTIKNNWSYTLRFCGGSQALSSAYVNSVNVGYVTDANQSRPDASDSCYETSPMDKARNWTQVEDMPHKRLMADNVLLPDGKILYLNGAGWGYAGGNGGQSQYAANPVFTPDLFDPEAEEGSRWTSMSDASVARLYHSGALLLASGHVISTGSEEQNYVDWWPTPNEDCWPASYDVCTSPFEMRIEMFTPPYLQVKKESERLVIDSISQSNITYQSTFRITMTSKNSQVDRITALRYGTSTHQLNLDQRFYELEVVHRKGNSLWVTAPVNGSMAPPGNWFIFALDSDGVPSVAKTVLFSNGPISSTPYSSGRRTVLSPTIWGTIAIIMALYVPIHYFSI